MMSFILMDRRAVKDNGGGIGLNVVLKTQKKDTQAYEAEQEYRAYSYIIQPECACIYPRAEALMDGTVQSTKLHMSNQLD